MSEIHPTAIIHESATIGSDVAIGPYCVVGEHVTLEDKVELKAHVVVDGRTAIGESTVIYPFASIGSDPQDLKYDGEPSTLSIGAHNKIREYVTIQPGTEADKMHTEVGDHCLMMNGVHIAHDCVIGNHVVLASNATVAGHVEVGDHAVIGGLSGIHQFVRIGEHAMIGGMSGIEHDVIPYGQANGERASLMGLNLIGLKRRGFKREDIQTLRAAYRMLFAAEGNLAERIDDVEKQFSENNVVRDILHFIRKESSRAICQPKDAKAAA